MDIYDKIEYLMKYKNLNRKEMCIGSNISYSTYTAMFNRRSERISMDTIINISNFFNVTVDYLMINSLPLEPILFKEKNIILNLSKDKKILLKNYDKLNAIGKEKAIERVEELTELPKYTTKEKFDNALMVSEDEEIVSFPDNNLSISDELIFKNISQKYNNIKNNISNLYINKRDNN